MSRDDLYYDLRLHLIVLKLLLKDSQGIYDEYKKLITRNFSSLIFREDIDDEVVQVLEELDIFKINILDDQRMIEGGIAYLDIYFSRRKG